MRIRTTYRLVLAFVITLACGVAVANPIPASFFNEIQVAPDSLERLELFPRSFRPPPIDLSGCTLVTRAGRAVINPGVGIWTDSDYVVIDRHNTTGTFSFGDDSDFVRLRGAQGGDVWDVIYPGDCFTPRGGASSALVWVDESTTVWYCDPTPTFGAPNDDTAGGISGTVFDADSHPVPNAYAYLSNPWGGHYQRTGDNGSYRFHPTGPGTFWISARWQTYTGAYPESVQVDVNQARNGVDVFLPVAPVGEPAPGTGFRIDWLAGRLRIVASRPTLVDLRMVNALGQICARVRRSVGAGTTDLEPAVMLPTGVYLVQGVIGKEKVNHKVTVFR
jgi:hypothetical protein